MNALPGTTGRRRIYLMRHGHVDYFAPSVGLGAGMRAVDLSEVGRTQALAAGDALAEVVFDRAVCSGLPRTRQTAELVLAGQRTGATPELEADEAFAEILIGATPGVASRRELAAAFAFLFDSAADPGACMGEGGEAFEACYGRVVAGMLNWLAVPDWSTMLLVGHEAVNRILLSWTAGAGLRAVSAFEQDLACVNILDYDLVPAERGDGVEIERRLIKAVNMTPYNPTKYGMNMTSLEAIFARMPG
jgi:probable phosphoglycerate mutase